MPTYKLTDEKRQAIYELLEAYIISCQDDKFIDFLRALNDEELATYFYVQTKQIAVALKDMSVDPDNPVSIADLRSGNYKKRILPGVVKRKKDVETILNLWDNFATLEPPPKEIRLSLVKKFETLYRPLTETEKKQYLES